MMNISIIDAVNPEGHFIKPAWNHCHRLAIQEGEKYQILAALALEESQQFGIRMWFSYEPMGLKVNPINVNLSYFSLSENPTVIQLVEKSAEHSSDIKDIYVNTGVVWINIQNIEGRSNQYKLFIQKVT